jgi:hypothetical protein
MQGCIRQHYEIDDTQVLFDGARDLDSTATEISEGITFMLMIHACFWPILSFLISSIL